MTMRYPLADWGVMLPPDRPRRCATCGVTTEELQNQPKDYEPWRRGAPKKVCLQCHDDAQWWLDELRRRRSGEPY